VTGDTALAESFLFVHDAREECRAKPMEQAPFGVARVFDLSDAF
jgi:hypothetical protein